MGGPPDRELGHIEPEVAAEQRIGDSVGDALPGQRHLAPPAGRTRTHQKAEQRPDGHRGEQRRG